MVQLFNHWFSWNSVARAFLETVLLILSAVLAVAFISPGALRDLLAGLPPLVMFAVTVVSINAALGLYQSGEGRSAVQIGTRILVSLLGAGLVAYLMFDLLAVGWARHELLEFAAIVAVLAQALMRVVSARNGSRSRVFQSRVMVLGAGAEAAKVQESLAKAGSKCTIVGYFPCGPAESTCVPRERLLKSDLPLREVATENRIDRIVVAVGDRRGGALPLDDLLDCRLAGIKVLDYSTYFEQTLGQVRLDSLRASWLIFGEGFRQGVLRTAIKRVFDVIASSVLLLAAAPVMIVTAILIVLESGFPVLYRQERVGQGGRIFSVIKFRSMRTDAERDGKPRWASASDSRVTSVGRWIRKLRIDELPQLCNVLAGDMGLVGPRPERPYFVDQLTRDIPFYAVRHSVKPGLTGWAQVCYHYGSTVDDSVQKLQYDLYYVKNHTLFVDIVILFQTVGVVLTGKGAR